MVLYPRGPAAIVGLHQERDVGVGGVLQAQLHHMGTKRQKAQAPRGTSRKTFLLSYNPRAHVEGPGWAPP